MSYGTEDGTLRTIVKAGLSVQSDGDVENACSGEFHLVEIPADADARAQMREVAFKDEEDANDYETEARIFDRLEAGWYFVRLQTRGSVFSYACEDKEHAFSEFADAKILSFDTW